MAKLNVWEVENEDGVFKIDLEKISFAGKGLPLMKFEDFYYHPNDNPETRKYFNISTKNIIKDIAIYYDSREKKIILCFKNNKGIVKILEVKGHGGCNDFSQIANVKVADFNCNCGNATLHDKPLDTIKNFDDLCCEKIVPFRRNKNYERI